MRTTMETHPTSDHASVTPELRPETIERMKRFVGFTEEDARALRKLRKLAEGPI